MATDLQLKAAFNNAITTSPGLSYDSMIGKIAANFVALGIPEDEALIAARAAYPNPNPTLPTGELPPIEQTFFEKYKWYIIITLLLLGTGGVYWSYKKLKESDEEEPLYPQDYAKSRYKGK